MSPSLKHLWAGDWRAESEAARRAREGENPFARAPEAPPESASEATEHPAPRPRTPPPRQSRTGWAVAAIGLTALAALARVPYLTAGVGPDEGGYAYVARQ